MFIVKLLTVFKFSTLNFNNLLKIKQILKEKPIHKNMEKLYMDNLQNRPQTKKFIEQLLKSL